MARPWPLLTLFGAAALVSSRAQAADPPPAEALKALILGGGKTAALADAWEKKNAPRVQAASRLLELAPGFPRRVESKDVEGLKPGFHILVAGFCGNEASVPALESLRRIAPGTYASDVRLPASADACPKVKAEAAYVFADGLPLGVAAGAKAKATAKLGFGEVVYVLERGPAKEKRPLGCNGNGEPLEVEAGYDRVWRARDATEGFVFSAGIRPLAPGAGPPPDSLVLAYHPDPANASEDWAFFTNDIANALAKARRPIGFGSAEAGRALGCTTFGRGPDLLFDLRDARRKLDPDDRAGYFLLRAERPARFLAHAPPDGLLEEMSSFFGTPLGR